MLRTPHLLSLGAGIAATSFLLAASSGATKASAPAHITRTHAQNASRHRAFTVAPSPCPADYNVAGDEFVAQNATGNVAGGKYSTIMAGFANDACDTASGVGAGTENVIGHAGAATSSFIAGGDVNAIVGTESFIGGGNTNEATARASFVGAGYYGTAEGIGSFVGAGGYEYGLEQSPVAGGGNVAAGNDSFVGAGDLNQITSNGNGSAIFAGGYTSAANGLTASNEIDNVDSFIGAGDKNYINSADGFIGSGTQNLVGAADAAIAGGGFNFTEGQSAMIGAGFHNASGPYSFVGAGGAEYFTKSGSSSNLNNETNATDAFVGAGDLNTVSGNGSFIGSGGFSYASTGATAPGNTVSGTDAFLGAGDNNTIAANGAFAGAGYENRITSAGTYATLPSGNNNYVSGEYAALGGGSGNEAEGAFAILPGGADNEALGAASFAAGYHAKAAHPGSFVWSDDVSGSGYATDGNSNEFVVRASGGTYFFSNEGETAGVKLASGSGAWASLSDRNAKTDIVPLDGASVLAKLDTLPVDAWQYKTERGVRHLGPMAQDFYAAFHVGEDDRHITSIDEDGVALAALKALHRINAAQRRQIAELHRELRAFEAEVAASSGTMR